MSRTIELGDGRIGPDQPCFVIAEAGVNHNGHRELAFELVDAAAKAGADAVKFQTFKAERLAAPAAEKAAYQKLSTGAHENQRAMLRRLELPIAWHEELIARCRARGLLFLSSPFDELTSDALETLDLPAFKIPSGELTNLPLLAHIARKGRTMLLSTGMATLDEVRQAVDVIGDAGDPPLVLLHCLSQYPADPAQANLRAMETLRRSFDIPVGYSDHTPGIEVALAAVALGANVIEKHFTVDRTLPGPDQQASLDPDELATLVAGVRRVASALGHGRKEPAPGEEAIAAVVRKSLVAARDLAPGTVLGADDLIALRPGLGISPAERDRVLGRQLSIRLEAGAMLRWKMLS